MKKIYFALISALILNFTTCIDASNANYQKDEKIKESKTNKKYVEKLDLTDDELDDLFNSIQEFKKQNHTHVDNKPQKANSIFQEIDSADSKVENFFYRDACRKAIGVTLAIASLIVAHLSLSPY